MPENKQLNSKAHSPAGGGAGRWTQYGRIGGAERIFSSLRRGCAGRLAGRWPEPFSGRFCPRRGSDPGRQWLPACRCLASSRRLWICGCLPAVRIETDGGVSAQAGALLQRLRPMRAAVFFRGGNSRPRSGQDRAPKRAGRNRITGRAGGDDFAMPLAFGDQGCGSSAWRT